MEVFTQFSSDLDENTKNKLAYGKGLMHLLRQPRYEPLSQFEQAVLLTAAQGHVLQDVPVEQIASFKREFLDYLDREAPELRTLVKPDAALSAEARDAILCHAEKFKMVRCENGKR